MKSFNINIIKNNNIIKNIIGAFFFKGGSMFIALFTLPVYMKYFNNQNVLGIWFTIISVLNWVLMFDLGLGNGLRNKLPYELQNNNYEQAKRYISSTYITIILFVVIFGLIGNLLIPIIDWNNLMNIDNELISKTILIKSIKIVFLGILIQFIFKTITSILYAIQESAIVNFLGLFSNISILIIILLIPSGTLEENLITMSWINLFAMNTPLICATIVLFFGKLKKMAPNIKYFDINCGKNILQIGVTLLWLQIIFMIISSTNEFLITTLTSPDYVVVYQAYNKIFNAASSLFVLALTPIWSAVTKAQAEKNYMWINKLYNLLLGVSGIVILAEFLIVPFLQRIMNIWLGDSTINVISFYAIIFVISNGIFIIHNVNTSICNGMSYFKVQIICMTFAALVDIPLAYIGVKVTGSWIGIVIANIVALLPYEILQPIYFKKYIDRFDGEELDYEIGV